MPDTPRHNLNVREECWHVFSGGVRVAMIALQSSPNARPPSSEQQPDRLAIYPVSPLVRRPLIELPHTSAAGFNGCQAKGTPTASPPSFSLDPMVDGQSRNYAYCADDYSFSIRGVLALFSTGFCFGVAGVSDEYSPSSGLGWCPVTASIIDLARAYASRAGSEWVILIDRPPSSTPPSRILTDEPKSR